MSLTGFNLRRRRLKQQEVTKTQNVEVVTSKIAEKTSESEEQKEETITAEEIIPTKRRSTRKSQN